MQCAGAEAWFCLRERFNKNFFLFIIVSVFANVSYPKRAAAGVDGEDGAGYALMNVHLRVALLEHTRELGDVGTFAAAGYDDAAGGGGDEGEHLLEPLARAARVAAEEDLSLYFKHGAKI